MRWYKPNHEINRRWLHRGYGRFYLFGGYCMLEVDVGRHVLQFFCIDKLFNHFVVLHRG